MTARLVVVDLDGTLIGSDLVISDIDRAAIARAVGAGIQVVLATGRLFAASKPFAVELGLHGPIAVLQGGAIYDIDSGRLLHAQPLSSSVALAAYDALLPKSFDLQLYFGDALYLDHMSAASEEYIRLSRVAPVMVTDLRALLTQAPPKGALMKLLAIGEPDKVVTEIPLLASRLGALANVCRSLPPYLEVTDPTADKGHALERMTAILGVGLTETVAIGDSDNDIPMFKVSSESYAVANATSAAKEAATHVVAARGAGVAEVLTLVCRRDACGRT
ncbi:MAG TPA: Cof-type HAD-IIB family hydrolase [Candidatus Eremiobacteraceae bacterium]|nr:Cof-type HAD-IIB family hydrolase [Candidatus Eremiobacteraceae bacterium]